MLRPELLSVVAVSMLPFEPRATKIVSGENLDVAMARVG